MASRIGTIINQAVKNKNDKPNILSFVTHERFQSNLGGCWANFYLIQKGQGVKGDWVRNYSTIPSNTIILPPIDDPLSFIPWIEFSAVMPMHKFGQFQIAKQISDFLGLPIISVEHTQPTSAELQAAVPELKKMSGDINIFISQTSRNQWGYNANEAIVIEHGIDHGFWKSSGRERKRQVLTVGNDMIGRSHILGFDILQRVCQNLPIKIVGDTKGLSKPAQNEYELKSFYDESLIYINPSRLSPIPMSLLESASMSCAIVTTDNNLISDIFTHNHDAIKTNDENEMRSAIIRLLDNPEECKRLGNNARRTIENRFDLKRFVKEYDDIFQKASKIRK